jgi:RNA polymerase sigma-70 factor (ECF subfamily)
VSEHVDPETDAVEDREPHSNGSPDVVALSYEELRKLDDAAVMKQVQAQNGDALAVLFDKYYRLVFSVALKILRDRAEAEDVLQSIFMEIYQRAGQFDPARGSFYTWLMQYAYHRSISRKNYLIVRQYYGNVAVDDLTDFQQGTLKLFTRNSQDCKQFVRQALAMLTEGQKRTIEMVHFEGLTLKEIAERREESFSNVRHHYYRGLAKLRMHLRSIHDSEPRDRVAVSRTGGQ